METAALKKSSMNPQVLLRRLYEWTMDYSLRPAATYFLCLLAFTESIFFPIPVDPVLMAMGAAKPKRAIFYALLASVFSVLGGVAGYFLGYWAWDQLSEFFFAYIISAEKFEIVMKHFQDNAFWAMFLAGFTPIPFKVFTVAAGVANIAMIPFLLGSFFSRSLRFGIEGALLFFFGPSIRTFIDKYFEKITLITGALIIVGIALYNFLK